MGRRTLEAFQRLASKGHQFDDDLLFEAVSGGVRDHQEFKKQVRELHVRGRDFQRLEELHRYLIVVLLDVARTKEERVAKQTVIAVHHAKLQDDEKLFIELTGKFLQPFIPKQKHTERTLQ